MSENRLLTDEEQRRICNAICVAGKDCDCNAISVIQEVLSDNYTKAFAAGEASQKEKDGREIAQLKAEAARLQRAYDTAQSFIDDKT